MIGTMTMTKAQPTTPMGIENLPRCQGPLRNLSPTKKMRMKIGITKATNAAVVCQLQSTVCCAHVAPLTYGSYREEGANG